MNQSPELAAACEREVRELHELFERWFRGELPDEAFDRVADALADDFELISPRGARDDRPAILRAIRSARGRRPADFRIRIQSIRARVEAEPICVLCYEEHQRSDDGWTRRISTAVFRRQEGAPCGVVWVQLHETWLPDP